MNLQNKNICILVCLNCPYGGNVVPSLVALARRLASGYGMHVSWVFPKQPKRPWLNEIQSEFPVRFTTSYDRKLGGVELVSIFKELRPDIIHTHYEAYDIPAAWALRKLKSQAKMVWHIHDYMSLDTKGLRLSLLRKTVWSLRFYRHYGVYGKNAYLLPVSKEMGLFASSFRRKRIPRHMPKDIATIKAAGLPSRCHVLLNGIVLDRLPGYAENVAHVNRNGHYVFLSFGGRENVKCLEDIVHAGMILRSRGKTSFRLLFTNGNGTEAMLHRVLGGCELPGWVELVGQSEDVASLYRRSTCYISAARYETMSTSIAEATLYGLPVIQSDIFGTYWNAGNPSTLLFPLHDCKALADRMQQIMEIDMATLRERCAATREDNLRRLSLDKWRDEIISIYQEL